MNKKIIVLVVAILLLIAGGVFYWQQNQKDVRELNKNLPKGVRVVKSLIGNNYKVVNKIDGYEFKAPKEWKGIEKIEYLEEKEKNTSGFSIEGNDGELIGVGYYKLTDKNEDLELWVEEWGKNLKTFIESIKREKINDFDVVKVKFDKKYTSGIEILNVFFKKDFKIYEINSSEDFIREIISNGRW